MISQAADAGKPLSAPAQKHIDNCLRCREFHELCLSLGKTLAREATVFRQNIPVLLSKRIQTAIAEPKLRRYAIRTRFWPVAVAAGITLVILASVLVLARRHYVQREVGTDGQIPSIRELAGQNLLSPLPALLEKPLTDELNNLMDDTESAVRFLITCVAVNVTDIENESVN